MAASPHVLLFMSDQHSSRFLGCGEDAGASTPTLDRLAAAGTRFTNCYCNYPLCVPSRMSFLTGRHCHSIRVWGNGDSLSSNIPTFAHALGIAGYRTVLAGRMHMVGEDQRHGFQERLVGDVSSAYLGRNRAEYRHGGFYGWIESLHNPGPAVTHDLAYDQAVTLEVCRLIRDHEESGDSRPLCVVVGWYAPHDPYNVYDRYYELFAGTGDLPFDVRGETCAASCRQRLTASHEVSEDCIRRARIAYRGRVRFIDDQVATILDYWNASALAANDVVIYTSDHGDMMGEHGLWTKSTFYEGAGRVPLIIKAPGRVPAGRVSPEIISLVDLAPTLIEIAGGEPLPQMDGRGLWGPLTGAGGDWPGQALSELLEHDHPARSIRRGPCKYNDYGDHPAELFNLDEDSREEHNLAADPAHAPVVAELRAALTADGWDPEKIRAEVAWVRAGQRVLSRYTQAAEPADPTQWGIPAPL